MYSLKRCSCTCSTYSFRNAWSSVMSIMSSVGGKRRAVPREDDEIVKPSKSSLSFGVRIGSQGLAFPGIRVIDGASGARRD